MKSYLYEFKDVCFWITLKYNVVNIPAM